MGNDAVNNVLATVAEDKADRDLDSPQVQRQPDVVASNPGFTERRSRQRYLTPYMFSLTPIGLDGQPLLDETTMVVGKDLSPIGISFSLDHDLTCTRAIITCDDPEVGQFAVEVEIIWTKRTPLGLFEIGCRLIRTINGHTVRAT